jgi:hypothetical protein
MLYKLFFTIFIYKANAFIHPPQIILPILKTDLEVLLTNRAIISSLIANLRNEITGDRLLLQFTDFHPVSIVYLSLAVTFIYGQWKFYEGSQKRNKIQKIEEYVNNEIIWKQIILIILYVFTKDVLSAS